MKSLRILLPYFIIFLFSVFAFKPLLNTGFFPIHDDTQVARTYEMTSSLKDGMFPVRWVKDLGYGYGYPIFNYYDPFPYYISGVIGVFTDSLSATKLAIVIGILISGFSMYLFARQFWGEAGGVLSAILYLFAPYHALDVYVRGDFAEVFVYAFIPLVFYGILKVAETAKWTYVIISSVSYALIITSHNLTALIITPFILLFAAFMAIKSKSRIKTFYIFGSMITGILLSAFYWLPAILEINYTNVFSQITGGSNFIDNFVCFSQLWTSQWGYGGSIKGCVDGLSFMIGKYHILLTFLGLVLSLVFILNKRLQKEKKDRYKSTAVVLGFIAFVVSLFFTLEISKPIWDLVKPMSFIQYPWRFLIIASFFASFVSGYILWVIFKLSKNIKLNYILAVIIIAAVGFANMKFFIPQSLINKTSDDYTNSYSLLWTTSKISDEYMPKNFSKPKSFAEVPNISNLVSNELSVKIKTRKTQQIELNLDVKKENKYIIPIAYFPSWVAHLDEKKVDIKEHQKGMVIFLPAGKHTLIIEFKQTPIEKASNTISITGIAILIAGIILSKRKYAKS